jgi:RNA polymerase sigma factor for flagellar operon FliA
MCTENQAAADDEWIVKHLPLVRYVVSKLLSATGGLFETEDLVSFGVVGLLQAKRRYDPSRGNFASYAIPRIRGAIVDALRANDFLPRSVRSDLRIVEEADREASALTGEHLTMEETVKITSLPKHRIVQARSASHVTVVPLEHTGSPNGDKPGLVEVVDGDPTPLERVEREDMVAELAWLVERLPEREKLIVSLHFVEGLTMREIGAVLSISESRVCQLQARALHRLRVGLEAA